MNIRHLLPMVAERLATRTSGDTISLTPQYLQRSMAVARLITTTLASIGGWPRAGPSDRDDGARSRCAHSRAGARHGVPDVHARRPAEVIASAAGRDLSTDRASGMDPVNV
jgi:hypothetical protein